MANRTIFTFTTGRSGTAWLADFFTQNFKHRADAVCFHEILDPLAFGYITPEVSTLQRYNNFGADDPVVKAFWQAKAEHVKKFDTDIYVETSHVLCKAGLVDYLHLFPSPTLIFLTRNHKKVADSMLRRADYINLGTVWLFYLDPLYPLNIIDGERSSQKKMIEWYLAEMEARSLAAQQYLANTEHPDAHKFVDLVWYTYSLEGLTNEKRGAAAWLLSDFITIKSDEIILPPPRN